MENTKHHKILTGIDGIKKVFESTLDNKEGVLRTALAGKPLVYIAGKEYTDQYMKRRSENNIHLKSLRFTSETIDRLSHTDYKAFDKEVRIAPDKIEILSSFVIWDDNVVAINVIEKVKIFWTIDKAYAQSIKSWYEFIWNLSH